MRTIHRLTPLFNGFIELLFPNICICCGHQMAEGERCLCGFCKYDRFEIADSRIGFTDEVLPEEIAFRTALWQIVPGGNLQEVMYSLKYGHLYSLGVEMGRELGKIVRRKVACGGFGVKFEPFLVPVPIHSHSRRKRGYNQAAAICGGIAETTGWHILDPSAIVRLRNTRSQTGLDHEKRLENVSGVFRAACDLELTPFELPVIVDDVYTTGATSMELSRILKEAGAQKIGIATLAEA